MKYPTIKTPRGKLSVRGGKAVLEWNPNFGSRWTKRYRKVQVFVDSEVLRLSEPFTPLLTGFLIKSGDLGTEIGSGTVKWIAPYARHQYYSHRKPGSQTGPLRGPFWFARGKQVWKGKVVSGARRIMRSTQ